MQLSIIIVNYKNPPLIVQCVKSILQFEQTIDYEIIVVDNNSEDDTEQRLRTISPSLKWIQMGYNSGFAKANNAGLKVAEGEYVLFLNADTILIEPIFEKMIQPFDTDSKIGVVGCRLLNSDKSLQLSYHNGDSFFRKLWWRNPFAIKMGCSSKNLSEKERYKAAHSANHNPRWICGAAMMMRRQTIIERNLYWDEDFFMYWEDVELCHRIRRAGLKVYYTADASIIHLGGGGANVPLERFEQMENSKLKCIEKIYGKLFRKIYVQLTKYELRSELRLERRKNNEIKGILQKEAEYYGISKV
ncbi:MAG: glycosyltransferase family 2 protein [Bacteroidales bacterium]|nr:glycosyltransferase family 2 protein [Bacteroidales bacterium]